jgi:hypothetical protein
MRRSRPRSTLSGMSRVRAVTAVLTALTLLAVVLGGVAAARQPAGSGMLSFLAAVVIAAINVGLAAFVAWKAPDNWCHRSWRWPDG